MKADLGWMQAVNDINADFAVEVNHPADVRLSKPNLMDVFVAELGCLKRIAAGMGLTASDGEDVLQDVSIKVMKQSGVFESREDSIRWLIKVTVNRCLMEHRRRRSFSRHAHEILKRRQRAKTASTATDEKVIIAEELEIVRESLRELDDSLLGPMVLGYFCDLNSREVGETLALSPSTVRSRLREARMILAKRLLERGVER
jgi:RNA polymerase sigma factor (sigma-70 family)